MKRREFLGCGVAGAGMAALAGMGALPLGAEPAPAAGAGAGPVVVPGALAAAGAVTGSRPPGEPAPIAEAEYAERRARAQRLMGEHKLDALFLEPGANLLYFSGIRWGRSERLFGMLLLRTGEPFFVVPAFEEGRAADQIGHRFAMRTWEEDASPYRLIADALAGAGARTGVLAVDESARYFVPFELGRAAPALTLTSAEPVSHGCRGVKSAHEIEIMRYANRITHDAYRAALGTLHEGMTQAELSRTVADAFRKAGYQGYALVLFGEASAFPHGVPEPRALRAGDVVLVDGGCNVLGYESDMTRTVVFGTPTAEQQRVWDTVRHAQAAALAAAAPGRRAGDVDAAARKVITDAGYGPGYRLFTHRLGHGIGLEEHEWPYLVRGSEVVLRPGMCFSDEPGIYQPGKFGVRTEDIMTITETGAELLTPPASAPAAALT